MKKFTHRLLPLALCFTLTLGAFAYRPSEAKAIAGVDDAVVIGALLSAFAGGCGLIFSNNGMTSSELAQGLTDKWNEFKAAVLETDSTFAGWLGYEDMDALLQAIVLSGGNALTLPRTIARKLADFTTWLKNNLWDSSGTNSNVVLASSMTSSLWNALYPSLTDFQRDIYKDFYFVSFYLPDVTDSILPGSSDAHYCLVGCKEPLSFVISDDVYSSGDIRWEQSYCISTAYRSLTVIYFTGSKELISINGVGLRGGLLNIAKYPADITLSGSVADLSVGAPAGVQTPDLADDNAANPTITGVGDGTATTIEGLLQQILAQLQANTLAPTLDVAGTESGGNTGTDEDAKPYLPYIPQIFGKIKDLPGTLANIWESIKGIPAAIAEKIGAFFTTLWGWLQNIIDAITALPAAIAEKIGALFKPDEALLTEITDAFKGKFGFFSTLKQFGNDLFGMTPETEPPVIWVHLENAESKYGYSYGDKQKIFDMTWYQKYKASVDGLLSGFLWLGYLWLLFKRAPSILNGMQMDEDLRPPLLVGDVSSAPRLGAGDPSIHYGEGFTFRSKGGKRK